MDTVAVITSEFLPTTQTFIYEEILGIKNYNVIVLTNKRQNADIFPYEKVYVCDDIYKVNRVFSKIIKKCHVKLIHIKFGTVALRYLKLVKLTGLPYIVSFHGYDASRSLKQPAVLSKYKKQLFPGANHIITVSPKLKENLVKAGCSSKKITVLWSGVDVEKFWYQPRTLKNNETVKLLCIARLTEKKGLQYLIESFAKVVKKRPNTELTIIGEGPLKHKLKDLISKLKLKDKIKMHDFIPHHKVIDIMHEHHLFCLPSIKDSSGNEEGIPNVIKEACATGMPVVSTYHSGIPELVQDGKNGFLVPEKDIDKLADRLIYLIDHPYIWESMGLYGRKHVEENFNKSIQAKKLEELYAKVINNKN